MLTKLSEPKFGTDSGPLQLERKRMDLEKTREQRRRLDMQLEALNRQQDQEEEEYQREVTEVLGGDMQTLKLSPGHQSEPTTPPEYRDQILNGMYSRRNRYSSMSLVSPLGGTTNNRLSRSGSQLTSPPSETVHMYQNGSDEDKLPSKSVPGSRRGSTDKFASYIPETSAIGRRSFVRYVSYCSPIGSEKASTHHGHTLSTCAVIPRLSSERSSARGHRDRIVHSHG